MSIAQSGGMATDIRFGRLRSLHLARLPTMALALRFTPSSDISANGRAAGPWRLHYYRDDFGNFGDDLNPWLWNRLLPGQVSEAAAGTLVGVGTILNGNLPAGPKLIAGSGVGYGVAPKVDDSWDIRFVRGPRTARALGLHSSMAITDPAYLLRNFVEPVVTRGDTVFIPHHVSAMLADWRAVSTAAGMTYVDPCGGFMRVIEAIRRARLVVTCAMHGAILADALRTPWVRVNAYPHINDFKWQDWGESVGVDVTATRLPALHDKSAHSLRRRAQLTMRAWMRAGRPRRVTIGHPPALLTTDADVRRTVEILAAVNNPSLGTLSADSVVNDRLLQLNDAVSLMRVRERRAVPRRAALMPRRGVFAGQPVAALA